MGSGQDQSLLTQNPAQLRRSPAALPELRGEPLTSRESSASREWLDGGGTSKWQATPRVHWLALAGVLAVAAAVRLYGLNNQLWLDEVSALVNSIRRPLPDIVTVWPGVSSHVFYEIWAHLSLQVFGESPFAIRLPAAIFGVAGVGALYLLAARLFERWQALSIAALFAVSYHHIFYSQDARSYTSLILFFILASHLFLGFRSVSRIPLATGLAYACSIALAGYSNLFGMFIPAAHAVIVLAVWLRESRTRPARAFPVRDYVLFAGLGGLIILVLYLPFVGSILAFTRVNAQTPGEGPRLSLALIQEVLAGLSAAFMGPIGVGLACAVGLAGLVFWYRRNAFLLAALLGPIVIQALVVVPLGIGIHPRYFAVVLPVIFLLGGGGFVIATRWLSTIMPIRRRRLAEAMVLGLVVLASAVPLARYYTVPKQDFVGAIREVEALEQPDDVPVGVYLAGHVIRDYYQPGYRVVDSLGELVEAEQSGQRLVLVTTLESLLAIKDRALYLHIRQNYRIVKVLPATVGDAEVRIYLPATPTTASRPEPATGGAF